MGTELQEPEFDLKEESGSESDEHEEGSLCEEVEDEGSKEMILDRREILA